MTMKHIYPSLTSLLFILLLSNSAIAQCLTGDCENGQGYFRTADSSIYNGYFNSGKMNGEGTYYSSNGDLYVGQFRNNKYHGEGTLYQTDGTIQKGKWDNGVFQPNNKSQIARDEFTTWYILVASTRYTHRKGLMYSDDSAYRFYAYLKNKKVEDQNIKVLIDEDATKESLFYTIRDFNRQALNKDNIVIFFSGRSEGNTLLFYNSKTAYEGLTIVDLEEKVNAHRFNERIFILETIADTANQSKIQYIPTADDLTIILSNQLGRISSEVNGLRQGLFAHFFMKALSLADVNDDKQVDCNELFNYIKAKVSAYSNDAQVPVMLGNQNPKLTFPVKE